MWITWIGRERSYRALQSLEQTLPDGIGCCTSLLYGQALRDAPERTGRVAYSLLHE
jgi:hypothetical protein